MNKSEKKLLPQVRVKLKGTSFNKIVDELKLDQQENLVHVRRSRVKRTMKRLVENLKKDDKYAQAMLKTYYKLYITSPETFSSGLTIRTRFTNLLVLDFMVGKEVLLYNGKTHQLIKIKSNMLGRFLGEFIRTRKLGSHSAKGISSDKIKR